MLMKLSVEDRLVLGNLVAGASGDFTAWLELNKFKEAVGFTDEENSLLDFEQSPGGGTKWNKTPEGENAVGEIEVEVTGTVEKKIVQVFHRLNQQEALVEAHVPLYARFCKPPMEE